MRTYACMKGVIMLSCGCKPSVVFHEPCVSQRGAHSWLLWRWPHASCPVHKVAKNIKRHREERHRERVGTLLRRGDDVGIGWVITSVNTNSHSNAGFPLVCSSCACVVACVYTHRAGLAGW